MVPLKKPGGLLSRWILPRILLRSFLLQASWNFERMQSLGFLYVLAPALRVFYRDDELLRACQRHLQYFNTHPFLASPILGMTLFFEEERHRVGALSIDIEEFKTITMAPYAAMGDSFFWGAVRPLASCAALVFALLGALWAPLIFLVIFNVPHLWFRIVGLFGGYSMGPGMLEKVRRLGLPDLSVRFKEATVILLGGICAFLVSQALHEKKIPHGWGLTALPLIMLIVWLGHKRISSLTLVLVLSMLLLLLAS